MKVPQTIGILGGMGPEATILLQRKLVEAVPARDDCDHIPLLIDMNPQVPSRIAHLIEGTGADPGPTLAAMARRLQTVGAVALAMPCNTAHHYAEAITAAVDIPLLNMVELAADHAAETLGSGGCVGMLASPAVRGTRLFETAFEARGLSVIWPKEDDAMLAAIRAIKVEGPTTAVRQTLRAASEELAAAGGMLQFVACSEFSLIADSVAPNVSAVDTIDLLAREIIKFAQAGLPEEAV
ncbi:aspartate/glutamate racemase family protein [Sulfitobacter mediterraneus]|uniref:Aspartate racemase n=1 Tax=Sulfitobacter mediterraneus TaxID=83219 RepID=A0A2T6BZ45_9RHOB|nr:amino acid racemase [Sulfitobacter mediterraneus]PTX61342.1 aspartate racemase [Sulfitobacter mediterraneus]